MKFKIAGGEFEVALIIYLYFLSLKSYETITAIKIQKWTSKEPNLTFLCEEIFPFRNYCSPFSCTVLSYAEQMMKSMTNVTVNVG
jgi:hypothetical protein